MFKNLECVRDANLAPAKQMDANKPNGKSESYIVSTTKRTKHHHWGLEKKQSTY